MKVTTKAVLATWPRLDQVTARKIVRLCNGTLDVETFEAAQDRLRACYNRPSDMDLVLTVVNSLVDAHGVEGVPWEPGAMHDDEYLSYVNMGDTYASTIVWTPDAGFEVTSWGDAYERSEACAAARSEAE